MNKVMIALAIFVFHDNAHAVMPQLSASCPGGIEVLADEGGPVYINGKKGTLKQFSDSYFEIKGSGVIIIADDLFGRFHRRFIYRQE
jgi:hypothetical protein